MQKVIGIDFGTSTTYMNVKRYNGDQPVEGTFSYMPVMFNFGESSGFVSTVIRENADGSFDFGEKAAEQIDGSKIYTEIKMHLEDSDEDRCKEARRIVKEFFKFLYATYSQQAANLGSDDDAEETVISYPVKWQEETAQFMLEAAREAGFKNVRGMDEATAAISTVLCHNVGKNLLRVEQPGYLLLVDMGAGTTDLVVCKYQVNAQGDLKVTLVNNWPRDAGEPTFGGREVDRTLEDYVENYLSTALNPALAPSAHVIATTPGQAKLWKERNVSANLAGNRPVTTCAYIGTYKSMGMLTGEFPSFDRKAFESFARAGLTDYAKLLEGCLTDTACRDADFEAAGLDLVVLTGGHSSWYFAREIVDGTMEGYLDHPALAPVRAQKGHVVNLSNPQTTVSLGLVYSKLPFHLKRAEPKPTPTPASTAPVSTPDPSRPAPKSPEPCEWDPRLLPIVKKFVQECAVLNDKISCKERYNPRDLMGKLELYDFVNDEIYHASDEFTLSLLGRNKRIITSSGFAIRWHHGLLGYSGDFITWEEFLKADLNDRSCKVFHVIQNLDVAKEFIELQQLLRQETAKLD